MAQAIAIEQIRNDGRKVEGALAFVEAWKNKLLISALTKFIIKTLGKIEAEMDLGALNRETVEQLLPLFQDLSSKYEQVLPALISLKLPFHREMDKKRLIYFSEYLEDIIEAMEIGLDTDSASKIESLANETTSSVDPPPWREALAQI